MYQGGGRGNVFVSKKRRLAHAAPRAVRRRCFTHVAMICDVTEVQPRLPQVLIGNQKTGQAGALEALRAAAPANARLLRRRIAWNSEVVCAWVIRCLGVTLAPYRARSQPVLLLDAARIHFTRSVLRACQGAGIWVVGVPASLTWLLQPLDTHGFQRYTAHMQRKYLETCASATATGALPIETFLP